MTGLPVRRANPARRVEIGSNAGHPHDAGVPADAGLHHEAVFLRNVTQDLAKLDPQPFRGEAHGLGQQGIKSCTLQSDNPQLRQNLLLADALFKGAERQVRRLLIRLFLHHRFVIVRHTHTRKRFPFEPYASCTLYSMRCQLYRRSKSTYKVVAAEPTLSAPSKVKIPPVA